MISASEKHELLYDYYGFPDEAYELKYDAPGSPEVAALVEGALKDAGIEARRDLSRGTFVVNKSLSPTPIQFMGKREQS